MKFITLAMALAVAALGLGDAGQADAKTNKKAAKAKTKSAPVVEPDESGEDASVDPYGEQDTSTASDDAHQESSVLSDLVTDDPFAGTAMSVDAVEPEDDAAAIDAEMAETVGKMNVELGSELKQVTLPAGGGKALGKREQVKIELKGAPDKLGARVKSKKSSGEAVVAAGATSDKPGKSGKTSKSELTVKADPAHASEAVAAAEVAKPSEPVFAAKPQAMPDKMNAVETPSDASVALVSEQKSQPNNAAAATVATASVVSEPEEVSWKDKVLRTLGFAKDESEGDTPKTVARKHPKAGKGEASPTNATTLETETVASAELDVAHEKAPFEKDVAKAAGTPRKGVKTQAQPQQVEVASASTAGKATRQPAPVTHDEAAEVETDAKPVDKSQFVGMRGEEIRTEPQASDTKILAADRKAPEKGSKPLGDSTDPVTEEALDEGDLREQLGVVKNPMVTKGQRVAAAGKGEGAIGRADDLDAATSSGEAREQAFDDPLDDVAQGGGAGTDEVATRNQLEEHEGWDDKILRTLGFGGGQDTKPVKATVAAKPVEKSVSKSNYSQMRGEAMPSETQTADAALLSAVGKEPQQGATSTWPADSLGAADYKVLDEGDLRDQLGVAKTPASDPSESVAATRHVKAARGKAHGDPDAGERAGGPNNNGASDQTLADPLDDATLGIEGDTTQVAEAEAVAKNEGWDDKILRTLGFGGGKAEPKSAEPKTVAVKARSHVASKDAAGDGETVAKASRARVASKGGNEPTVVAKTVTERSDGPQARRGGRSKAEANTSKSRVRANVPASSIESLASSTEQASTAAFVDPTRLVMAAKTGGPGVTSSSSSPNVLVALGAFCLLVTIGTAGVRIVARSRRSATTASSVRPKA